ncbi:hypothetical protein DFQ27_008829 [Actinomortierella ambigua]|uniref:Uncharacterized protein n=1 Tax=Actinomortierella ambigua TaxID=1343610 RepID=A0A9P6TXV9_9FUNG|nr:hypothetical protein DFQ27_008829 [Actinomortierella ambigua]
MSAAFGQNEMWQQHIQMQLQLQQQQEQQAQQTGNRKRVLATEADEFMGIKKRNLGSEAVEHGIYALGGFDHVGGANGSVAPMATANHHSFSGVGVSPSASATPISAGAFFTSNMTTTVSSDYFGLPPTSQPNQGTAPFFTSRQDSCNSNSAPATPSIGFPGASSNTGVGGGSLTTQMPPAASSALPSSSSSANRFGWPNNGSGGVGGAISNPSTPVTETTAMMLSQNSMSMQQMEEKQILQRNQHYEQMSLYATQQLELEALHLKQEAHAFERALAHQHGASGASYDQPQQQQQQQQQSYQAHTIEVDRSAHARHSHAVHDNNDPATWGGEASSPMQLRGYLAGQGRGYTPATMGVAALAAAAAMAQSQRSNNQYQQPSQGLVAPTGHQPPQFDEGVGMDMDMANSADLRKVFDASEQEAMMQMIQMMETNTAAISSSLQDTSPPLSFLSLSNTMPPSPTTAAMHSFSSSSVYLSSSSLSFPTWPGSDEGTRPPKCVVIHAAPVDVAGQQSGIIIIIIIIVITSIVFVFAPVSIRASVNIGGDSVATSNSRPKLFIIIIITALILIILDHRRHHATPLVLSTSQYQFVMGFRADCELCQRRVKGHNAHLVSRPCAGSSSPMR